MPPLTRRIPRCLLSSSVTPTSALRTSSKPTLVSLQKQQRRNAGVGATDHASHGGDHGHESHYDQPGGWLWGIRPGEKYEKEGWENLMWYGFAGGWVLAVAFYVGKEDTSIQTWALEEARRRLEKEGILEDPDETRILEEKK